MLDMQFKSTKGNTEPVSFLTAMRNGLAKDGGLYVPDFIPKLSGQFWNTLSEYSLQEIGYRMARPFLEEELPEKGLRNIIDEALNFDIPLVPLSENRYILELFHGPTLAFKDVGARFMARIFANESKKNKQELVILVATSGDTGGAVAHGFADVSGVHVCLLYPGGKVSALQEKQMTTAGGNVSALEVKGTFDDCQYMVKKAFTDAELSRQMILSSANSINIARLLPQSFYYVYALSRLPQKQRERAVFSVPSGNFGNLTAGLMAMKMGMPATLFIAATNSNDVVPVYLEKGIFQPRTSQSTISNAMDVGNPSNFARIKHLLSDSHAAIKDHVLGYSATDAQTRKCIREVYEKTGYILDPHSAIGYLAAQQFAENADEPPVQIILGTAHPAKFREVVEQEIGDDIELPAALARCMKKEKQSHSIDADYEALKRFLQDHYVESSPSI